MSLPSLSLLMFICVLFQLLSGYIINIPTRKDMNDHMLNRDRHPILNIGKVRVRNSLAVYDSNDAGTYHLDPVAG